MSKIFCNFYCGVDGAVVTNNEFCRKDGLVGDTVQLLAEVSLAIVGAHGDRNIFACSQGSAVSFVGETKIYLYTSVLANGKQLLTKSSRFVSLTVLKIAFLEAARILTCKFWPTNNSHGFAFWCFTPLACVAIDLLYVDP